MAGFADAMKNDQPTGMQPGGQDMAEQDGFGEGGEQATEEEQKLLDAFMQRVGDILIPKDGQFNPQVIADLKGDIDPQAIAMFKGAEPPVDPKKPQDAIAAAGVLLLVTIDSKMGYQVKANSEGDEGPEETARETGETPEGEGPSYTAVLWEAGQQLIGMLCDMAEQAGITQLSDDDVGNVWLRATDLYRYASPTLDREAMKKELVNQELAAREGKFRGLPNLDQAEPRQAQQAPQQQGA